jgi:DNA-binding HxlR family transcriptional regulator
MSANVKKNLLTVPGHPSVGRMVEDVVGCKWSLTVLQMVRQGIHRPGVMERSVAGLTPKVLNERLRKLVNYGIFKRCEFAEIPPHVEYTLTPFGVRFLVILDAIETLQKELET